MIVKGFKWKSLLLKGEEFIVGEDSINAVRRAIWRIKKEYPDMTFSTKKKNGGELGVFFIIHRKQ